MIEISIPHRGALRLRHLTLDVNGTLTLGGTLIDGVVERLRILRNDLEVHLLTADTFGTMAEIEEILGLSSTRVRSSAEKAEFVAQVGAASVVAVGNGANDAEMLAAAALGVAVLGPEGLSREALEAADVLAPDILAALDLLHHPRRLVATLRR